MGHVGGEGEPTTRPPHGPQTEPTLKASPACHTQPPCHCHMGDRDPLPLILNKNDDSNRLFPRASISIYASDDFSICISGPGLISVLQRRVSKLPRLLSTTKVLLAHSRTHSFTFGRGSFLYIFAKRWSGLRSQQRCLQKNSADPAPYLATRSPPSIGLGSSRRHL